MSISAALPMRINVVTRHPAGPTRFVIRTLHPIPETVFAQVIEGFIQLDALLPEAGTPATTRVLELTLDAPSERRQLDQLAQQVGRRIAELSGGMPHELAARLTGKVIVVRHGV